MLTMDLNKVLALTVSGPRLGEEMKIRNLIRATAEFSIFCPDSAVCMCKSIAP